MNARTILVDSVVTAFVLLTFNHLVLSPSLVRAQATAAQSAETPDPAAADPAETPQDPPPETEELPLLSELPLPADEQLLRGPKEDWIVLRNERTIVTEPVSPRPRTLEAMRQAIDAKLSERRGLIGADLERFRQEFNDLHYLALQLPNQADESDYLLHLDDIGQAILHEDLMLRRVDQLIRKDELELAYEFLIALEREYPQWPGADVRHHALLMAEADRRLRKNDEESALLIVEELHGRNPGLFGLSEKAGEIISRLAARAVSEQDWRAVRHFIGRLSVMFPDHPVVAQLQADLTARAQRRLADADRARAQGNHALAAAEAEQAAFIWPQIRNLRARVRPFLDRYQRLHVGVVIPRDDERNERLLHSSALNRRRSLTELRFFEPDRIFDGGAHYRTRFCERWEPLNLGRRLQFDLRTGRQAWESQPVITAPDIAEVLAQRLDAAHPSYDERFASYTDAIVVHSPYSFSIEFRHVPAKPDALLTVPVLAEAHETQEAIDGEELTSVSVEADREIAQGFTLLDDTQAGVSFRRVDDEADGLAQYHVAEIHEHTYADSDDVVRALQRGDVSLAAHLPAWEIDRLRKDEASLRDFFVQPMALPVTHVLQFHPRSLSLQIREYRRALAYALNRPALIEEYLLRGASSDLARTVDGPFPSTSYATSALVRRRPYDPMAAVALLMAARQQLGGELPPLKMIVPTDPVIRSVAEAMVKSWERFGVTVQIEDPPVGPLLGDADTAEPAWDLAYRTVQMAEPVTDLWPFLTFADRARVEDLDAFPDWLRQEIIGLDQLSDWNAAVEATRRLHEHLSAEMHLIPLWEVDEYLVYRKNIRGVPPAPVHPYQRVDGWVVETWYPTDTP